MSVSIGRDLSARSSARIWMPDARPLVADPSDDEFDSQAAFDARWTEFDDGAFISRSVANGLLTLSGIGNGSTRCARWHQQISGSEFVLYTKAALQCTNTNWTNSQLFVGDVTASAVQAIEHYWESTGTGSVIHRYWPTYNTTGANTFITTPGTTMMYLRLRVNGTTVAGDFSADGMSWIQVSSVTTPFTPVTMGVAMHKYDANAAWVRFSYFRCIRGSGSSAFNATRLGREVQLAA